ncbi:cold-shock protein [Chitinophaga terrae (ex Kim and Jung 2007)]|nr:cold-shock protein [Chitinophaga terrae (ex Kim and Jung 2007)]
MFTIKYNNTMQTGVVKFFNETKGFGFIKIEGSGQEIFVHVSGIKESISENDRVVFDIEEGRKGPNAVNVRLA